MPVEMRVKLIIAPAFRALARSSRHRRVLDKHYRLAAKRVGQYGRRRMRRIMTAGVPPPNAPMTVEMKGSSKPLFGMSGGARLFKSVASKTNGRGLDAEVGIGVFRTSSRANVARIVHGGARLHVTARMALMFKLLYLITSGEKPNLHLTSPRALEILSEAKGNAVIPALMFGMEIVIPPRPFAQITARDRELRRAIKQIYRQATVDAMNEIMRS